MATESEENGTEMQPEVEDSSYSLARLKLENLLNKSMTIRMTDGRTLVGLFLCTDRDCNVILGSAQEFLKSTGFKENATCSRASYLRDSSSRYAWSFLIRSVTILAFDDPCTEDGMQSRPLLKVSQTVMPGPLESGLPSACLQIPHQTQA
ncbi:N-alpha-acetyltransferase 38, NatC auxiliary subunit isoform X1 [Paramisgurnus dabryanus]|uniref:N-alpha-acetyltransferase 38, NatC auxiliary subunit isoform X1 n=1 Tax=Paramisgurnus dabryanus TaxID=90735 RepID=UPI0031F397BB